jgi:hypothetical protein
MDLEYKNVNDQILVYNLPLSHTHFLVNNIVFEEFYNIINYSLLELIDKTIKKSLEEYTDKYCILGGKALNKIISNKYLIKSFDFDIHVKKDTDINKISKYIITKSNSFLNLNYKLNLRKEIFIKLKKLNIVDDDLKEYYMTNDLFFYGLRRVRRVEGFNIASLFIKLKLKEEIFKYDGKIINYTNYYNGDYIQDNDLLNSHINIIYLPIADIDNEYDLNYGINIFETNSIYNPPSEPKLNYANYSVILYNSIKNILKVGNKANMNIKKFNFLQMTLYYNCEFLEIFDYNKINKIFCNIIKDLTKNNIKLKLDTSPYMIEIIKIKDKLLYNNLIKDYTYIDLINDTVNSYLQIKNYTQKICNHGIKLLPILTDVSTEKQKFELMEELVFRLDYPKYYVCQYTNLLYKPLNTYCNYIANDLPITIIEEYYNSKESLNINLSNHKTIKINIPELLIKDNNEYNNICDNIDSIFKNFHDELTTKPEFLTISDYFEVLSYQDINNFTTIDNTLSRSLIDLSHIRSGDIIEISQYLSTTFNMDGLNSDFFYKTNNILYKIIINKNIPKWLFINKYSEMDESEILLKRNSFYVIINIEYKLMTIKSGNIEVKIITMELIDNLDTFIKLSKNLIISGMNENDNILESRLCMRTLNYVYDNFFSQPFKESNICKDFPGDGDFRLEEFQEFEIDGIIVRVERPNHSLAHACRVLCWIQLFSHSIFKSKNKIVTQEFIFKTCIASIFMVSGRESEASFGGNVENCGLSEEDKERYRSPYYRYLDQSAKNFKYYAEKIIPGVYTPEEIKDYMICLRYYYNIYTELEIFMDASETQKIISSLFTHAHGIDLIRCKEKISINGLNVIDNLSLPFTLFTDILEATGDRILSHTLVYTDKSYSIETKDKDPRLFYLCSTNPEFCVEQILNVSREYFMILTNPDIRIDIIKEFNLNNLEKCKDSKNNFSNLDHTLMLKLLNVNKNFRVNKNEGHENIIPSSDDKYIKIKETSINKILYEPFDEWNLRENKSELKPYLDATIKKINIRLKYNYSDELLLNLLGFKKIPFDNYYIYEDYNLWKDAVMDDKIYGIDEFRHRDFLNKYTQKLLQYKVNNVNKYYESNKQLTLKEIESLLKYLNIKMNSDKFIKINNPTTIFIIDPFISEHVGKDYLISSNYDFMNYINKLIDIYNNKIDEDYTQKILLSSIIFTLTIYNDKFRNNEMTDINKGIQIVRNEISKEDDIIDDEINDETMTKIIEDINKKLKKLASSIILDGGSKSANMFSDDMNIPTGKDTSSFKSANTITNMSSNDINIPTESDLKKDTLSFKFDIKLDPNKDTVTQTISIEESPINKIFIENLNKVYKTDISKFNIDEILEKLISINNQHRTNEDSNNIEMINNKILNSKYGSTFFISRKSYKLFKKKYEKIGIYFLQSIINSGIDVTDYNIKDYNKIDYSLNKFTSIKFINYIKNKDNTWLKKAFKYKKKYVSLKNKLNIK